MSDIPKTVIAIKNAEGKLICWATVEEAEAMKAFHKEMVDRWLFGVMYGFPEPTEEEKYLRGIHGVITKERGGDSCNRPSRPSCS